MSTNESSSSNHFFPDLNLTLTPSQLNHLKQFWVKLIDLLYPNQANQSNTQHNKEQDEEIQNIIQSSNYSIHDISNQLWDWIMMDDPDQMLLKFIRAKKFKSNLDALKMLLNNLIFRIQRNLNQIKYENSSIANQLRIGKAFVFGLDKSGCPIFRINAAKHKPNDQTPRELEDFVLYSMETTRLFVVPPAQHISILVDLSGFGMSNMDWKCTTFMISTLEAHYPETLNFQIIHNAPWIFQGLWKAISTMLDPVVKSKVMFTSKDEDLLKMIDKKFLFKYEGGQSEFKWGIPKNYPIDTTNVTTPTTPKKNSNANANANGNGNQDTLETHMVTNDQSLHLTQEEEKIKMNELQTRQILIHHFISLTQSWLSLSLPDSSQLPAEESNQTEHNLVRITKLRELVKMILRAHYLKLMKYTQPKTIYHYREILNSQEPGIMKWNNSNAANNQLQTNENHNEQPEEEISEPTKISIVGVDSARPNLLRLINEKLNNLRPEFTVLPTDNPSQLHHEDDLLNKIFVEISQLEF